MSSITLPESTQYEIIKGLKLHSLHPQSHWNAGNRAKTETGDS